MKIKPVEIHIKDDWKYALVALLVDRKDFLEDLKKARKEVGIKRLMPRPTIEREFKEANKKETEKKYKKSTPEGKKVMKQFGMQIIARTKFDDITIDLLGKYRKSNSFHYVIKYAIISNVVEEKDLQIQDPIIWAASPNASWEDNKAPINPPQIAIIVEPEHNPEDVSKSLKRFIASTKKKRIPLDNSWYIPYGSGNIKRDRKWYWLHEEGKSYEHIRKMQEKEGEPITRDGVIKAVQRYEEKLAMDIS